MTVPARICQMVASSLPGGCVCVCMSVHGCGCACAHACLCTGVCMCVCVCMGVCMCACMFVHGCVQGYARVCMGVYGHVCGHVCVHVSVHGSVHGYVCMFSCARTRVGVHGCAWVCVDTCAASGSSSAAERSVPAVPAPPHGVRLGKPRPPEAAGVLPPAMHAYGDAGPLSARGPAPCPSGGP